MKISYFLITDPLKEHDNILLVKNACDNIVFDFEYYDGTYRRKNDLLKRLDSNDTLIIYELSHVVETLTGFFKLNELLISKSIRLISIKEGIDTARNHFNQEDILRYIIEVDSISRSKKTIVGLNNARRYGAIGGRKKGLSAERLKKAKEAAKLWDLGMGINEILEITGLARATCYRYLHLMGIQIK